MLVIEVAQMIVLYIQQQIQIIKNMVNKKVEQNKNIKLSDRIEEKLINMKVYEKILA